MENRFTLRACALSLALAISPILCLAQPAPVPGLRSLATVTRVKPEMLNEWMDLQKNEVVPALKKAGITQRTVLQPAFGNVYEFTSLTPLPKFAIMDEPGTLVKALGAEAGARLTAKLRKCIDGTQTFITTRLDELSNPPASNEPPQIYVTTRRRIAPGKMQEYENLIKAEVLPVYKNGKVLFSMSRRGLGANPDDMVSTTYPSKFAELDNVAPFLRLAGQEAATKLTAKLTVLGSVVETLVRRRVADLSY